MKTIDKTEFKALIYDGNNEVEVSGGVEFGKFKEEVIFEFLIDDYETEIIQLSEQDAPDLYAEGKLLFEITNPGLDGNIYFRVGKDR